MCDDKGVLQKIRSIADYQFGKGVGVELFPDEVRVLHSKRTGRIRHVFLGENRLVTFRPSDGFFSLTIMGAQRIMDGGKSPRMWVKVQEEAEQFLANGKSAFAKHVIDTDEEVRSQDEVIVLNRKDEVLAVGRATLSGEEMIEFERGVAVLVRKGVMQERSKKRQDYGS